MAADKDLIASLTSILAADRILTDDASVCLYAQDIYTRDLPALAVIRPLSVEELSAAVKEVTSSGRAIIPRGGGMSYTSGYVPSEAASVIVDMQGLNRVLEINKEDMYVTVECGCTWKDLNDALQGSGLRTPFWGTLSGIHATVGGGISQNSIFWGSGKHGSAADTVLGLEVVLADGSVVTTGTNSQSNGSPFARHYGPDLTGLFTCDTGALGFKAVATLRLVAEHHHREFMSFSFNDYPQMVASMSDISRRGLAEECFAFDPNLSTVRMQRQSLMSDVKQFAGVLKSAGSLVNAIKDGTKVAIAGRGFMKDVKFSLHVMVEERVAAAASAVAEEVRSICKREGAAEIENSIPKILRANPFTPLNNMIGPNGELWAPVHTVVPHSKAAETLRAVNAVFAKNSAAMEKHGIGTGLLLATVSTNQFVVEPVFFTPDSLNEIHRTYVEDSMLKKLAGFDANPDASAVTAKIRQEIIDVFQELGGVHMQIGKAYPYREGLRPESWRLIQAIKKTVDPASRVNPGSLGLE
jgi:FAD/FMN-containing dehydrogenase